MNKNLNKIGQPDSDICMMQLWPASLEVRLKDACGIGFTTLIVFITWLDWGTGGTVT